MAKKQPTPARPQKPARPPRDPAEVAASRRRAVRVGLNALGLIAVGAGTAAAVVASKRHVEARPAGEPPRVVLLDRPAWMSDVVADRIAAFVRPAAGASPLDHALLRDRVERLRDYPWVERVNLVRRAYDARTGTPGGLIEVDCAFRAPAALVAWRGQHWLVDAAGVMLPEAFDDGQAAQVVYGDDGRVNVRRVTGVTAPPAGAGLAWPGDDLRAGLALLAAVAPYPFAQDVVGVDVGNYDGRLDRNAARLVLLTRHGTLVRWGRPVDAGDFYVEATVDRKLYALEAIYREYGRVDAGRSWIDVRFDDVNGPDEPGTAPVDRPAPSTSARMRGR